MNRAVTAIYNTADVAELVRTNLEQLGIGRHNITVLPSAGSTGLSTSATAGSADDAVDQLHDLGLPEEDARTYQQALRNGDYVVSVDVEDDANLGRVQEVMRQPESAYDLDELDTRYSAAEYTPPRQQSGRMSAEVTDSTTADDGTVQVVEEQLAVGKREAEAGRVRVRSFVRELPVEAQVDLRSTRVFVERHPVNRTVSSGDVAFQDQTLEAREHVEEAVVAKEARVVEEIGLREQTEVHTETVHDTVRKTEVEIEDERTGEVTRVTGDDTTSGTSGGRI